MSKKGKFVLWVLVLLVLGMLSMNMYINLNETEVTINEAKITEVKYKPFLEREEINQKIGELIDQGHTDKVVQIYADIIGDTSLAHMIISFALIYDIPVSLLFSVISVESDFDPMATNKNPNGSYDYGLMSLNSKTFKKFTKEQLLEQETNIRLGSEHLIMLKNRYKSWGEAVIHYNGLYTKGAGTYMVRVLEKEREFERMFNEQI
jgi:hypothetical protein